MTEFVRADLHGSRFDRVDLDAHTEPVHGPGWPEPRRYPVRECLLCILNEEWEHRLYAERDLAVLEACRLDVTSDDQSTTS